jgi:hypothetical protein
MVYPDSGTPRYGVPGTPILRHKNVTTTERYIQNINKDLCATMNLLSENGTRDWDSKAKKEPQ